MIKNTGSDQTIKLIRKIFRGGFILLGVILAVYQVVNGNYYHQRAKNNYVRVVPLPALRGSIFDRRQNFLAADRAVFNISVIPYQTAGNIDELLNDLSKFLNLDYSLLAASYTKNLKNLFSPVDLIKGVDKNQALEIKAKFNDRVLINPQPQRFYFYPEQFCHVLGYVKEAAVFYEKLKKYGYHPLERVGFLGIEQYYDSYLKGQDGGDLVEVNSSGRLVGFLGELLPKKGSDIYLTVDKDIQLAAADVLDNKRGVIILMDSYSGEIIAFYSAPSFNPNSFIRGISTAEILNDKGFPLLNRAIQSTYPPGSTFKPLLGLAGLEEEKIAEFGTFSCEGKLKLGRSQFNCWDTHAVQNIYQALAHSCNVYFYNLGLLLGPQKISHWAKKFRLDSSSGIDLPYEKKGFVPTLRWKQRTLRQNWFAGDTLNFSIGQGYLEVTPLAITLAINTFANGGYLVTPHLIKKIDNASAGALGKNYLGATAKNLKIISQGLRQAVADEKGTARLLEGLKLAVAGKTGTAQNPGKPHGWFIGYFPYKDTGYTLCVFLENGISSQAAVKSAYLFLKKIKENNWL